MHHAWCGIIYSMCVYKYTWWICALLLLVFRKSERIFLPFLFMNKNMCVRWRKSETGRDREGEREIEAAKKRKKENKHHCHIKFTCVYSEIIMHYLHWLGGIYAPSLARTYVCTCAQWRRNEDNEGVEDTCYYYNVCVCVRKIIFSVDTVTTAVAYYHYAMLCYAIECWLNARATS